MQYRGTAQILAHVLPPVCSFQCKLHLYSTIHIVKLNILNRKEISRFTNLEKNVYEGLQDVPTQTELAVLTLYAQAISHPYMQSV
jgi:hypothetical protein